MCPISFVCRTMYRCFSGLNNELYVNMLKYMVFTTQLSSYNRQRKYHLAIVQISTYVYDDRNQCVLPIVIFYLKDCFNFHPV